MENKEKIEEILTEDMDDKVNEQEETIDEMDEGIKENTEEEVNELKVENNELKEENKKLENELDTLKERLLRVNAEYENFRNRTEKEKKEIYTDACGDVLENILPVYDNLQRAIMADGSVEDLRLGIEAVMKQFIESLKKLDVEEISAEGEFDPNYHNAIMHIEDDNFDKNQIVEVFQKGFKRGDKVLRYSLVKVAN
ncbi:nucleotide exchange factor GrpE [Clostridium brassicae]|uniref:Protein GrpE n=1 Tax=Clostridium brassicae TaxID=2999072 RepID=A0ABT4DC02_9CLOT|nr:nucleotide exchange factor GrpE [Clostridium brassicae]MCY6959708.1 nucleotide exchange factor GrpE [Clostridium brassicae]